LRVAGLFVLAFVAVHTLGSAAALGKEDLRIGQRYKIVGDLYAYGVADNLNTRELSLISLVPLHLSGPEIVSRQVVPKGSVLTIIEKMPKRFLSFLYSDRYAVRTTEIDVPRGIPVVVDLCCGIRGKTTPLSPAIFEPLP
jgi:hypothetical protein